MVLGVSENSARHFKPDGLDPDGEIYGKFHDKIRAEPEIGISYPLQLECPGTSRVLYVFEVLRSTRRPHLPSSADERLFWKRVNSSCRQMTLEEIRQQMLTFEEKREKLALLLIDLHHKQRAVAEQAQLIDGQYTGDIFTFEIIDRVVVESYSLLRDDTNSIGALDTLKRRLNLLNLEKQKLFRIMGDSYSAAAKISMINEYRDLVRTQISGVSLIVDQIERSFTEKFDIRNPYRPK